MAKIYTIPNIITFVRIILIPIILYLASLLTGISVFSLAKNSLKPEIAISLNKIIMAGIT